MTLGQNARAVGPRAQMSHQLHGRPSVFNHSNGPSGPSWTACSTPLMRSARLSCASVRFRA
eukprot:2299193-Lingulodinium_polyedra.AAC.1